MQMNRSFFKNGFMKILKEDASKLHKMLQQGIEGGYNWLACEPMSELLKPKELYFIESKIQGEKMHQGKLQFIYLPAIYDIINEAVNFPAFRSDAFTVEEGIIIDRKQLRKLEESMNQEQLQLEALSDQVRMTGLRDQYTDVQLKINLATATAQFSMPGREQIFGDDTLRSQLFFEKSAASGVYEFASFKGIFRKGISIEHKFINGIDTRQLEKDMQAIPWKYDDADYYTDKEGLRISGVL
jgi:hypothetical protein